MKNYGHYIIRVILILSIFIFMSCSEEDISVENEIPLNKVAEENYTAIPKAVAPAIMIPEMPFWENPTIIIDTDLIRLAAEAYIAEKGDDANSPEFFMGFLPLFSADEFCQQSVDKAYASKLLGNLYISGYFGGVWLRDALNASDEEIEAVQEPIRRSLQKVFEGEGDQDFQSSRGIFNLLAFFGGIQINGALSDSPLKVLLERFTLSPFLMIYGYNWGYFHYILENPPKGMDPPEGMDDICQRLLDCSMPGIELATLYEYKDVLDSLYDPPSLKWLEMRALLGLWGQGSVAMGENVWDTIMSNSNMSSDKTYDLLLDLSGRFMMMSELSLLPTMKGYAEGDSEAGKCGLLQEAGMMIWAGSYFMGLGSPLPQGTFPEMVIP